MVINMVKVRSLHETGALMHLLWGLLVSKKVRTFHPNDHPHLDTGADTIHYGRVCLQHHNMLSGRVTRLANLISGWDGDIVPITEATPRVP